MAGFVACVCLLLMGLSSYDAIHVHRSIGPLEGAPLTSHHCLLCLAAHVPATISTGPAAPLPRISCTAPLPLEQLGSYESAGILALYTRPPPPLV
jgi:hypothetical protein